MDPKIRTQLDKKLARMRKMLEPICTIEIPIEDAIDMAVVCLCDDSDQNTLQLWRHLLSRRAADA